MKKILFISLLCLYLQAFSQVIITGKVIDASTREALAFANVYTQKSQGSVTDFDGKFELKIPPETREFQVSYIGYQPASISITPDKKHYIIELQPATETLQTVVINGKYVNPAIALMKKAIRLKKQNNYQKKLPKYAYTKYLRFVMDADADKIPDKLDTVYKNGKVYKIDSTLYQFKKDLSDKYMWIFESLIKVNAHNGNEKSEIIATRTAGLKKPFYEFLAMQVSGQNVYDDNYKFLFQSYTGPFSKSSFKQYKYEIDDTLSLQGRPVIVVDYKNTVKPLISGKIYLDSQSLAIAKLTLNTYKEFQLNAVYEFTYYPQTDVWFPASIDINVKKAENKNGVNFGDVIKIREAKTDTLINQEGDTLVQTRKQNELDFAFVHYRVQMSKIKINENYPEKIKYNMQVHPMAYSRNEDFWRAYTGEKSAVKAQKTYQHIDSIAEKEKWDQGLSKIKKIVSGYYPVHKYFDFDFFNLLDYNRYEKFRLQLGGKTSENWSKKWQISTYVAYGFGDKAFKYSGRIAYQLWHATQTYLRLSYTNDLNKSGSLQDINQENLFIAEHHLADDKFYQQKAYRIELSHLIIPAIKLDVNFTQGENQSMYPIPYHQGRIEFPQKDIAYIQTRLAITPFTKYYLSSEGRKVLQEAYPQFYISFEKNFPGLSIDPSDYYRVDLQTLIKKTYRNQNYTELLLQTGFASQGAGIDKLYQPATNNFSASNPLKAFNLNKKYGFETMNDYEFVDNFLVTAHLRHTFTHIKTRKDKSIDISWVGRLAFGLSYDSNKYIGIQSLDDIYYESGLEFKHLLGGLGLGFYYRLGAYAHDDTWQNLAIRLNLDPMKLF